MATSSFRNFSSRLRADGFVFRKHRKLGLRAINKTGSNIAKDKLVAVSGYDTTAKLPKIVLADADVAGHRDVWVTLAAISDNEEGHVYKGGLSAATLDTNSASAAGDPVYLSTTAGGFLHTAPTGATARQQIAGYVITKSATVGQIHWDIQEPIKVGADDLQSKDNTEVVTATNVITAAETGKTFFLNSATEFVSTLPAVAAGLRFTFVVTAAPSGASYTIVTDSSANVIKGQVYTLDVNSATDPDFEATGGDTITLVDGKAIAGDRVDVICDGTNWFAYGFCSVFDAITITTAS